MMTKEHLTPDRMEALKSGLLSREETVSALEHIGECESCADAFAERYEPQDLLELPPDFRSAVFSAIELEQRTVVRERTKIAKQKYELFRYSFRVGVAACITLLLLFSGTMSYGMNFSRSIHADLSEVNVITENLRGLSNRLIDFEITKYLKEEL